MTKRRVLMVLVVCSLTFSWHASVVYNYMGSLDTSFSCYNSVFVVLCILSYYRRSTSFHCFIEYHSN